MVVDVVDELDRLFHLPASSRIPLTYDERAIGFALSTRSSVWSAGRWPLPYWRKTEKVEPDSDVGLSSTVSDSI
jgi:hypothetical protein